MIRRLNNSFRAKVAGACLLTSSAALLFATGVFFARQWTSERKELIEDRTVSAQVIAGTLAAPLLFRDHAAARDTLASARAIPDFDQVALFDSSGALFASAGDGKRPITVKPGASAAGARYGRKSLEIHVPVMMDGAPVGQLVLVLGLSHFQSMVAGYVGFAGFLLLMVGSAAGFLSYMMAGRVIRPVGRLSSAIREVRASGDFSVAVPKISDDELGRLTDDFNGLLDTLQVKHAELETAMGQLVEARDAAEAASATKSQFLANMSHEIRTPLNGVLGMAQVMARDPLSDAQRERLDVIRASGQGLLSLLNDLLDLSKIEAARLELEVVDFDLDDVVRAAADPFRAVAEGKDLDFAVEVAEEAAGTWRGDPTRVRQIISNLISNALKFTREGQVRVLARRCEGALEIAVSDTGIGIPANKLALLFNKFSQADASTTREFGGTGLGLAISRELARLMGGDISVTSIEGQGTTFTLAAPLLRVGDRCVQHAGRASDPASAAEVMADHPLRILAAEDNATNQLVLRAMLAPLGAELEVVSNGAQAIEAWRAGGFDLILMDVQMPVMDGVVATREIRALESAAGMARIPIIALTANSMKHQVSEYLGAGMDDLIPKPIETEVLYSVMERVLDAADARAADAA